MKIFLNEGNLPVIFCFVVKSTNSKIRLFGLFFGHKVDFSGKKRTNLGALKKKAAIRPRSDKADLLGSTGPFLLKKNPWSLGVTKPLYSLKV